MITRGTNTLKRVKTPTADSKCCPNCGQYHVMATNISDLQACSSCGYSYSAGTEAITSSPHSNLNPTISKTTHPGSFNYGWICPKCGSVFSPTTDSCPHCSKSWEITY